MLVLLVLVAASAVIQYSQSTTTEQMQEFGLDVRLQGVNQKHTIRTVVTAALPPTPPPRLSRSGRRY